jgi:hypothetical protein
MVRLLGRRREREAAKPEKGKYPYSAQLGSDFTPGQGGNWDAPDWTREPLFEDIGDGRRHWVVRRRD